jgi:hypothetical protein
MSMARREIGTRWDRENRNNINENFRELYDVQDRAIEEATQSIIDSAKLIWLEPVNTFADIATTYPSPEVGHTVFVRDTGKVYRFYDGAWMEIQQIDAGPVNEVDTRLSAEIEENRQEIEQARTKADGTTFPVLRDRLNSIDDEIGILSDKSDSYYLDPKFPPAPLVAAKGDGVTDDTVALQGLIDYAIANKRPIRLSPGTYLTGPLTLNNDNKPADAQWGGISGFFGVERNPGEFVTLRAKPGAYQPGQYVLTGNNLAGAHIGGFCIDCNNVADSGLDMSWVGNFSVAPSTSTLIEKIWVEDYLAKGINLDNAGDARLSKVIVRASTSATNPIALSFNVPGGAIFTEDCDFISGVVEVSCQNAVFNGTNMFDGLRLVGDSRNHFVMNGGQIFPNKATNRSIDSTGTTGDFATAGGSMNGVYFASGGGTPDYFTGRFYEGLTLTGCFISNGNIFGTITKLGTSDPIFRFNHCVIAATMNNNAMYVLNASRIGSTFYQNYSNKTIIFDSPVKARRLVYSAGALNGGDASISYTPNLTNGSHQKLAFTSTTNFTFNNPTNGQAGDELILQVSNGNFSTAVAPSFGTAYKMNITPATITVGKKSIYRFVTDDGVTWYLTGSTENI